MKRILYLSYYFRPDLCAGSFRNSPLAKQLSEHSRDKNIRIDVYTTIPNRYASFDDDYQPVEESGNMTIHRLTVPRHQSGKLEQMRSFLSYYRQAVRETRNKHYDLVFASSSRFFTSWLGYKIAVKKNALLYVDVRDIFSETLRDLSENLLVQKIGSGFVQYLEKKVYGYAEHINLISEGFLPSFKDFDTGKFSYYSHGVDPLFAEAFREKEISGRDKTKNKIEVLYAGNIGDAQQMHKIIPELAARLQETHQFTLIGDGAARTELEKAIKNRSLDNVTIRNPVQREELIRFYRNCDILFIHIAKVDVFKKVLPSKLFEYAATGRVILAGIEGYGARFIKKHVEGAELFTPGSPEDAVRAFKQAEHLLKKNKDIDRTEFVRNFLRTDIDKKMVQSILSCLF